MQIAAEIWQDGVDHGAGVRVEDVDNVGGVGGGHQDGRELDDLQERRYTVSVVALWRVTNEGGFLSFYQRMIMFLPVISLVTLLINKIVDDAKMHF